MKNIKDRLASVNTIRAILVKGVADLSALFCNYLIFSILVRYIGVDSFGAYTQLNTIVGVIVPLASLGLGESMVRFFSIQEWTKDIRNQFSRIIGLVFLLSSIASVCIILGSTVLNALFLKWSLGAQLFQWGAPLVVLGALEHLMRNFFRARQWIIYHSIILFSQSVILVFITVIIIPRFGLIGFLKLNIIIKFFSIFIMFYIVYILRKEKICSENKNKPSFKEMIFFGFPMTISGMGALIMNTGDRLVIGHFLTPEKLGLYGAVFSFACLLPVINSPLNFTFYPQLMQTIATGNMGNIIGKIRIYHRFTTLLVIPGSLYLTVIMKPLLVILGGDKLNASFLLIAIMITPFLLEQWNSTAHYVLACYDRAVFIQNTWLAMGVFNLLGNIAVVPFFGLTGAAIVSLVTFLVLDSIFIIKASKYIPIFLSYRFDVTGKALLSSLSGCLAIRILINACKPNLVTLVLLAVVFGLSYLVFMIIFKEIGKTEFNLLLKAVSFKKH